MASLTGQSPTPTTQGRRGCTAETAICPTLIRFVTNSRFFCNSRGQLPSPMLAATHEGGKSLRCHIGSLWLRSAASLATGPCESRLQTLLCCPGDAGDLFFTKPAQGSGGFQKDGNFSPSLAKPDLTHCYRACRRGSASYWPASNLSDTCRWLKNVAGW